MTKRCHSDFNIGHISPEKATNALIKLLTGIGVLPTHQVREKIVDIGKTHHWWWPLILILLLLTLVLLLLLWPIALLLFIIILLSRLLSSYKVYGQSCLFDIVIEGLLIF
eukprot:TRINITY_DN66052_c0_g1_i1.p2 TRINITY_DN66052_c0_g1~~TRINITY_DN66052_c0_g1_i1.p2  ORF type:complete len:110 (-),score=3.81 TRINITY_DN66052_c0_g1_i1:73-402(-)